MSNYGVLMINLSSVQLEDKVLELEILELETQLNMHDPLYKCRQRQFSHFLALSMQERLKAGPSLECALMH